MLLGAIYLHTDPTEQANSEFNRILSSIQFESSSTEKITFRRLQLCFMRHSRLPSYNQWHADHERDLIVVIEGHLYAHPFEEENIPQAIAVAYQNNELAFLDQLNGDFSIGIFDFQKNKHFLIKDHLGIVPLSYANVEGVLYFSNDTMGLTKGLLGQQKMDTHYLASTFFLFEENYAFTPISCVHKVEPGHVLKIDKEKQSSEPYWFPEKEVKRSKKSTNQIRKEVEKQIEKSVQIRSNSDYTCGAHSSGGLDSGVIAYFSHQQHSDQTDFPVFCWSPSTSYYPTQIANDERNRVEKQSRHHGFHPYYCNLTDTDYQNALKNWRAPSETLFESCVLRHANKLSVNLIFSGWGGDEFISMGSPFLEYDLFWSFHWKKLFQITQRKTVRGILATLMHNVFFPKRKRVYLQLKTSKSLFHHIRSIVPENRARHLHRFYYTSRKGAQLANIHYKHLSQRCEDWYVMGQRNGVEYRYPLLDKTLIEYLLQVPTALYVYKGMDRGLLRFVAEGKLLPEQVRANSKSDPVRNRFVSELTLRSTREQMDRFDKFKQNPYLSFFDFERVKNKYNRFTSNGIDPDFLFSLEVQQLAQLHEFTLGIHGCTDVKELISIFSAPNLVTETKNEFE